MKAFEYIKEASQTKKVEICRLLGVDATTMNAKDIEDYLGDLADSTPRKVVDAFEDVLVKVKLFLYALVDKKIVTIDQHGVYQWGALILGINEASALTWLQLPANSGYVKRLRDLVYPTPETVKSTAETGFIPDIALPVEDANLSQVSEDFENQVKEQYKQIFGKPAPPKMKVESMVDKIKAFNDGNIGSEEEM
jgi:hypothetical protein